MKVFGVSNLFNKKGRVTYHVSKDISSPEREYLKQAKGMVTNYLKDKKENISIGIGLSIYDDCISVHCTSKKRMSITDIKKNSDIPLLRKVYMAVENFAKDCK